MGQVKNVGARSVMNRSQNDQYNKSKSNVKKYVLTNNFSFTNCACIAQYNIILLSLSNIQGGVEKACKNIYIVGSTLNSRKIFS